MARYGSEAVARTTQFEHEYAPEQSARTSFEVVPGGGLDADARRGVSSQFIQRVKLIAVAAALFLTLGVVRIGISTLRFQLFRLITSSEMKCAQQPQLTIPCAFLAPCLQAQHALSALLLRIMV